jgi:hypothetical protein
VWRFAQDEQEKHGCLKKIRHPTFPSAEFLSLPWGLEKFTKLLLAVEQLTLDRVRLC